MDVQSFPHMMLGCAALTITTGNINPDKPAVVEQTAFSTAKVTSLLFYQIQGH